MEPIYDISLQLGYRLHKSCIMIMGHIHLWLVTLLVTMGIYSMAHALLHYIVSDLKTMFPSHQYVMLYVQGK